MLESKPLVVTDRETHSKPVSKGGGIRSLLELHTVRSGDSAQEEPGLMVTSLRFISLLSQSSNRWTQSAGICRAPALCHLLNAEVQ